MTQRFRQLAESSRSELKPVGATSLLPERFGIPDVDRWSQHYPIEARKVRALTGQTLTDAITVVGNFVDPILAGIATGSWGPGHFALAPPGLKATVGDDLSEENVVPEASQTKHRP